MASENFKFGVTIEKYTGTDEVVKIPAEIDNVPVKEIGAYAFNETQLSLFEAPRQLKEIYIPEYVTYIGEYAFWNCNNLIKVTIASEDSIDIAENAFKGCHKLTEIVFTANNSIEINFDAFENCCNIERVYIDTENWSYASVKEIFGKNPSFEILPLE